MSVALSPCEVADLAVRHGGTVEPLARARRVRRLAPVHLAAEGDLGVLLHARYVDDAIAAAGRGAALLIDASFSGRSDLAALPVWRHPHASWVMAELLASAEIEKEEAVVGPQCRIGPGVHLMPGVRIGARVTIGPGSVIGAPGFGFVTSPSGAAREVPHHGGVVIEDDVHIGPLCTIAAGTMSPTVIRRGAKLDAQVHVGHNCEIGEDTFIAAQCGFAGSVVIGRRALIGGQVGIADHVTVGDGAKIAGKSGVIGDIPAGTTYAGYPAVERYRWLRGFAELYRRTSRQSLAEERRTR